MTGTHHTPCKRWQLASALPGKRDTGCRAAALASCRSAGSQVRRWLAGLLLLLMAPAALMAEDAEFTGTGDTPRYTFNLLKGFDHSGAKRILLDTYRTLITGGGDGNGVGRTSENFCSFQTYEGRTEWLDTIRKSDYTNDSDAVIHSDTLTFTDGDYELITAHYFGPGVDEGPTFGNVPGEGPFNVLIGQEDTACGLYYSGNETALTTRLSNQIYGVSNNHWDDELREADEETVINLVDPPFVAAQLYTFGIHARDGSQSLGDLEFDFTKVHAGYSLYANSTYFTFPGAVAFDCSADDDAQNLTCSGYDQSIPNTSNQNWRINNVTGDTADAGKAYLHYRASGSQRLTAGTAYTFTVTGYAGGDADSNTSAVIVVNAEDIDFSDQTKQNSTFEVNGNDNLPNGVPFATIQAIDTSGANDVVRYRFVNRPLEEVNTSLGILGYSEDNDAIFRIVNTRTLLTQAVVGVLYYIGNNPRTHSLNIVAEGGTNSEGTKRTRNRAFTVTVRDLGFAADNYAFTLNQGFSAPGGIVVGTVTASDPSDQTIMYEASDDDFVIDNDGVMRYTGGGITAEVEINLTVTAEVLGSDGMRADNAAVAITIINQSPPEFATAAYTFELLQYASASPLNPILLGTVAATDVNQEPVSYVIRRSDFSIDTDGSVSYIGPGLESSGFIIVEAYDQAFNFTTVALTIVVLGVEFTETTSYFLNVEGGILFIDYSFTLSQGADGSLTAIAVGTVAATDAGGEEINYRITDPSAIGAGFGIDFLDGVLSYNDTGLYDSFLINDSFFLINVEASTASELRNRPGLIYIDVQNDLAPVFLQNQYDFTLRANVSGTQSALVIGTVAATDPNRDQPIYSIIQGNDDALFSLNASGVLSYIGSGEAVTTLLPELVIGATDEVPNTSQVPINISVIGLQFERSSYTFSMQQGADGSQTQQFVGVVAASDTGLDRSFTYTVFHNDFSIDSAGNLYYLGANANESDVAGLNVSAIATDNEISTVPIIIELVNTAAPVFEELLYSFTMAAYVDGSSTPPGVVVGTVEANDDNQAELLYATNFAGFSVGETTGIVYYTAGGQPDGEVSFSVSATDEGGFVAFAVVTVDIIGLRFEQSGYTFSLEQGISAQAPGDPIVLGTLSASNTNPDQTFDYLVQNVNQPFAIDANGVLQYTGSGEQEATAVRIIVSARDPDQQQVLDVAVALQNTRAPLFDNNNYTFDLAADAPGTYRVGTVFASDPNGDQVGFSIQSGDTSQFSITSFVNFSDGQFIYYGVIDYIGAAGVELGENLSLTVGAMDINTGGNSNTTTVYFTVIGLQFEQPSYTFPLIKGAAGSNPIGTVGVVTSVAGSSLRYGLVSPSIRFGISRPEGIIYYVGPGEADDMTLIVTVTDQERNATTAVLIDVQNTDSPVFTAPSSGPLRFDAGRSGAFVIGTVSATDANRDQLTYTIASVIPASGSDRFSIDTQGVIRYIGSGENIGTNYTLTIEARDEANNTTVTTAPVEVVYLQFTPLSPFIISKGQPGPYLLGTIIADDPDNDAIRYSISDTARFSIGADDGRFYYTGTGEMETVTLSAAVTATTQRREIASDVVVIVQNDRAPEFVGAPYIFPLDANRSGSPIPVTVGTVQATDGNFDELVYAISSGDSGQFQIDASSGVIGYTGSGATNGANFVLTASVSDGAPDRAPSTALVNIQINRGTIERNTKMTTMTLAQVARNIAIDTVDVLGSRFAGAPPHVTISGNALNADAWQRISRWTQPSHWQRSGDWDEVEREYSPMPLIKEKWHQFRRGMISNSAFLLRLGADDSNGDRSISSNWTLWGQGRYSAYTRESDGVEISGGVLSAYLGTDYTLEEVVFPGDRLLFGVVLSHSINEGNADATSQRIDTQSTINNISPYLQWSLGDGTELWGAFGFGFGTAEIKSTSAIQLDIETDINMQTFGGGLKHTLATIGDYSANSAELSLKADAFLVSTGSAAAGLGLSRIDASNADSYRLRIAVADHRRWPVEGAAYDGGWELGGRLDGGDAAEGLGLDVGVNLGYTNTALGLTIHSQGRWLLAHSDELGEWGIDLTLRLRPQLLDRGLSLAFEPGWGHQSAAAVSSLWRNGTLSRNPHSSTATGTYERRFAPDRARLSLLYGLFYHRVLLQPFMEMGMAIDDVTQLKLGLKLSIPKLGLELVGDQAQRIGINSRIEW